MSDVLVAEKGSFGVLGPGRRYASMRKDEEDDALLWSCDIGRHSAGEFSFAIVQAKESLEDHSHVDTGPAAIFVGVYDGHGGPDASKFIRDHFFLHLMNYMAAHHGLGAYLPLLLCNPTQVK